VLNNANKSNTSIKSMTRKKKL